MATTKIASQNGVIRNSKWPLSQDILFITIEHDVVYNLTVNQNIISRYVKVIQTLNLFFLRFMRNLVHFQI